MVRSHKQKEHEYFNCISIKVSDVELENINLTLKAAVLFRLEYIRRAWLDTQVNMKEI